MADGEGKHEEARGAGDAVGADGVDYITGRELKNQYLREWRARRKAERPDEAKEANRRAYERLKSNPEKYRAHAQRVRSAYVPKPRAKKTELTEEQKLARKQRIAETKRAYWDNNPEKYQEHLRKCAERNKRLRRAGLAMEVSENVE